MPAEFATRRLPAQRDVVAPDGSDVRILLGLERGGMAHFELAPGRTSKAVAHRSVEEIWYFVGGRGEMCLGAEPLAAVAVTLPPWPGEGEAYEVRGKWEPV
jgi:mannose-6-phosphate isomerase-like protein (cupin superfamily)